MKKLIFFLLLYFPSPVSGHLLSFKTDLTFDSQNNKTQHFLTLFQQQRFASLNNELTVYLLENPYTDSIEELTWFKGHSLLQMGEELQARSLLISLIGSTNLEVKHRALYDLAHIARTKNDLINENFYLQTINNAPENSPLQEIARAKLIIIGLSKPKSSTLAYCLNKFETAYPNSRYLEKLQYYYALYQFQHSSSTETREYVLSLLKSKNSPLLRRLMAELELSDENFNKALEYLLPLAENPGIFQDEALYKAALILKLQKNFQKSRDFLVHISRYFKDSLYYERALAELATLNIILKNYDDALTYFLHTSLGENKAPALLKITEIYYLKGDTLSTKRTATRLQKEFPYSSYANEAIYWLGRSHMSDKAYQKSIQQFDEYLIREPQSPKVEEIQIFLGQAYAQLDDQSKARSYFQQIVRNSKNPKLKQKALLGLGHSYSKTEPIRSLEFYDRVWANNSLTLEAEQALYFAGVIRYNLRFNKAATKNFSEFNLKFKNSSLFPDSTLALAKLQFKEENFGGILSLDELKTDNLELLSEYKELQARSFFRVRDFEKALPLFQESSSLTKNQSRKIDLFLAEASTLRSLGRHTEAVRQYEKYLENTQENKLAELLWSEIITSYIEAGKPVEAEQTLVQMTKNFPTSTLLAENYFKIGDIYFSTEQYTRALPFYDKVLATSKNNDTKTEASFRSAWSSYKSNSPIATIKLKEFLQQHPQHYTVPTIMLVLSTLEYNEDELKTAIINQYPNSSEAETAREYFTKQITVNSDISEITSRIQNTKDTLLKAQYLYTLATKFELNEDFANALQIYLDIHNMKDQKLGALSAFRAAEIHQQQEEYNKSLRLAVNIISQYDETHTAKALSMIINSYIALGEYENAEKFKERLISQYPDSTETQKILD